MYLTRMKLDLTKRKAMLALTSPNLLHGAVESSFRETRHRNLWRLDQLNGSTYLMILSAEKPDLTDAVKQFGCPSEPLPFDTKDYTPLLERIQPGMLLHFRLTANPVKNAVNHVDGSNVSERGEVKAHITPTHQKNWLISRSEKHGFSLKEDDFDVVKSQWYQFRHGNSRATLLSVTFEGLLTVTDAELFREVLVSGLGRGKAYGMGLMTVIGTR